jgi:diguanylate cyclase (GGDEF)-like protein/putative nucleotidyltransferase with HDIG domain
MDGWSIASLEIGQSTSPTVRAADGRKPLQALLAPLARGLVVAGLLFVLFVPGGWLIPLLALAFYLAFHAHERYMTKLDADRDRARETAELHLATIEALARAIEAKQEPSRNHPWRVQLYAARLAAAIGLSAEEIHGIRIAALLHDIGKLAVPEPILSKTGPLTNEEIETVRAHARIGAELVASVPFTYPVAAVILSHHECWDGTGYPRHLNGEGIPLGARILSVVDTFDSLTTGSGHEPGAVPQAVEQLEREAGGALDPRLVRRFVDLLPALLEEAAVVQPVVHQPQPAKAAETATQLLTGRERVFENIAQAHREVYALYEIAQSLSTSLGVTDTMALLSDRMSKIVPWSACSLFLYDRARGTLIGSFGAGLDAPRLVDRTIEVPEQLSDWLAGVRRTVVRDDPRRTFEAAGLGSGTVLKSAMSCPLYFGEAFVGVFSVYHVDRDPYSDDHRRLFERVSDQAGVALHNLKVLHQTQEDAVTDQLTGLPNRRWLHRYLPQELARAERPLTEVALMSIDIDGFKTINDVHGHDMGDRALRVVANALLSVCRPYDVCARLSGDEFVVVLPNCSREAADLRREELQQRVAAIDLHDVSGARLRLGASAGIALFPYDGTGGELLEIADRRMYSDKAARRHGSYHASEWFDHEGQVLGAELVGVPSSRRG